MKVLDFGIAKLLGDTDPNHQQTQTGMIMGTPAYMSPEQCRGAGRVDHRTDVYALGCVLFHLLTGRVPFVANTPGDLIAAHLTVPPPAPSSVTPNLSAEIDAVVLRCLAKELAERVGTMTELVAALDGLLAAPSQLHATLAQHRPVPGEPVTVAAATTMASSAGETVPRTTPAWRGGLIVVGVAAVGAAIVAVALLAGRGGGQAAKAPADAGVLAPAATPDAPPPVDAAPRDAAPRDAAPGDAGIDAAPKKPVKRPPQTGSAGSNYNPMDDR